MIIGIPGESGEGKTTTAVKFILDMYKIDVPLYSNMKSLKMKYTHITKLSDIEKIERGVIYADELWLSFDSRNSMSTKNQVGTRLTNQIRKHDVILFYTLQQFGSIDLRVRENTNIIYSPTYIQKSSARYPKGYISYEMYKRNRMGHFVCLKEDVRFNPIPIWQFFNTKEKIQPLINDLE